MSLLGFRRFEWEVARRLEHLQVVAYKMGLSVITALALPRTPGGLPRFFQRTVQMKSMFGLMSISFDKESTKERRTYFLVPRHQGSSATLLPSPVCLP